MITVRTATQTQQGHHRLSLNSNTAGSPLPLIPRRPSHVRPALTPSPSLSLPIHSSVSATSSTFPSSSSSTTVTPSSTTSHDSSDTPSSSSTLSVSDVKRPPIRKRRVRGVPTTKMTIMCPPELSSLVPTVSTTNASASSSLISSHAFPTKTDFATTAGPSSRPMLYTPGMPLRLSVNSLKTAVSQTHGSPHRFKGCSPDSRSCSQSASALAVCEAYSEERPIRKKSGALVKSSLKSSSRSRSTSSLAKLNTSPTPSKSEPGTPSSKMVHFDAKLVHVKLFLAEQKPLAVSRDGSPTDDTSGTDSDFPRFIFGSSTNANAHLEGGLSRKRLVMHIANMPVRPKNYANAAAAAASDVVLEGLCLAPEGKNILGKVRVRNLAFSKSIAVRFTFDLWQTTSEVTGRYAESLSPEFDLFSFSIRLNDLLARIEGKTLVLAVRYSVSGREMWDNNGGQNYVVTFSKMKPPTTGGIEDLQSKLEKVFESKDRTGPAFAAARHHQPLPADPDAASFRTTTSLASRYDFSASLKSSWNPALPALPVHNRTQSFPQSNSSSSSAIPWPQKTPPRSPRDGGDEVFYNASRSAELDHAPRSARNHHPGHFNIASPSLIERALPGTHCSPRKIPASSPSRFNSFPPMEPRTTTTTTKTTPIIGPLVDVSSLLPDLGDSELSTPSMATPSSSPESSPSPKEIFLSHEEEGVNPGTHYRQFLDKFCFFTGPGSTLDQRPPSPSSLVGGEGVIDSLPRTHSASDINEILCTSSSISPRIEGLHSVLGLGPSTSPPSFSLSPTRSSSLDDLLNHSGMLTPTVSRLSMASWSAFKTPVLS